MKSIAFAILLLAGCTTPDPKQAEQAAYCAAGGGCHTVSMAELRKLAEYAYRQGAAAGAASCKKGVAL